MSKSCKNCKHRELWEGLCINPKSEWFAIGMFYNHQCKEWEKEYV